MEHILPYFLQTNILRIVKWKSLTYFKAMFHFPPKNIGGFPMFSRGAEIENSLLTLSWQRLLSYRNQSMDWFLYDNGLRHGRVNGLKKF